MCLHVKRVNQYPPKLKVAKEDITAYKVLEMKKVFGINVYFRTPYYHYKVETKEVTASGWFHPDLYHGEYQISGGVIHCYKRQEDAENLIAMNYLFRDAFIVKLTIPKGTKYIEGVDNDGRNAIGAEKIVYDCEPSKLYNNRVYPK